MPQHCPIIFSSTTTSSSQSTTSGYSYSVTVGAGRGRVLLVVIGSRDTASSSDPIVTGVTYNSVALTQIGTKVNGGGATFVRCDIWYLKNPDVGTANVSITLTGSVNQSISSSVVAYNVDQATPEDQTVQTTSGDPATNPTLSITTQTDYAQAFGAICLNANQAVTPASSQTELLTEVGDGANFEIAIYNIQKVSPGSQAMNLTTASVKWSYVLTALRPRRRLFNDS